MLSGTYLGITCSMVLNINTPDFKIIKSNTDLFPIVYDKNYQILQNSEEQNILKFSN